LWRSFGSEQFNRCRRTELSDLKDTMELPADCDAEAEGLLRPVLAARMAAASRYKGTVNQVMGDGIMALVDDPIAARGPRRARVLRGAQDAGTCEEIC